MSTLIINTQRISAGGDTFLAAVPCFFLMFLTFSAFLTSQCGNIVLCLDRFGFFSSNFNPENQVDRSDQTNELQIPQSQSIHTEIGRHHLLIAYFDGAYSVFCWQHLQNLNVTGQRHE